MTALLSLLVCLSAQPHVCETVTPDYIRAESGEQITFMECLGFGGQAIARQWIAENPRYELRRVNCSVANDPVQLRERIESPQA